MRFRAIEKRDLHYLDAFLAAGFPKTSPEYWQLLFRASWEENPAYQSSIPRGWILEDDKKSIRGFIGNIPFHYLVRGKKVLAAASAGWYVQPALRGIYSLQLLKAFSSQENIDIFLSTTPNNVVKNILVKLGFSGLPLPFNQTEYWLILDLEKVLSHTVGNRFPSTPAWLIKTLAILALPLKLALDYRLKQHMSVGKFGGGDYDFSICQKCDDSFTDFWEDNKKNFPATLYRDAETLNWLYFSSLVVKKRIVVQCTFRESQKLAGYFVFDLKSSSVDKGCIMQLKDFVIPRFGRPFFQEFLSFSIRLANELGADAIRIWPVNDEMNQLLAQKITLRRRFSWPYFAKWNIVPEGDTIGIACRDIFPSPIEPDRGFS